MHTRGLLACGAAALLLASCGQGTPVGAAGGAEPGQVACGDATFASAEAASLPPLDSLPDEVLGAVDDLGDPAVDPSAGWRVASAADDDVVLLRELAPGEPSLATGDTHATARLSLVTGASNVPDGTWMLTGSRTCALRLAEGASDDQADLRLAEVPSPEATELDLLVMERRCASGRSAEGRIDLDGLVVTDDEVRVQVSVRPPPGDGQDCQGNPWTPFTVELDEPLGDRTVVDGYLVPPRELLVGPDEE